MAEDLDLDRVIRDPAYRRRVIARLNLHSDDRATESEVESQDARVSPVDRRELD